MSAVALAVRIAATPGEAFSVGPDATDSSGVGRRLVEAPANANGDPRAQIYVVDNLDVGMIIHRKIEIANTISSTAHVALYSAAASDGAFLDVDGHTANDSSTWTSISPSAVDVAARATITFPDTGTAVAASAAIAVLSSAHRRRWSRSRALKGAQFARTQK